MHLSTNERDALIRAGIGAAYWQTLADQGEPGERLLTWFREGNVERGITFVGGGEVSWRLMHVLGVQMTLGSIRTNVHLGARVVTLVEVGQWLADLDDQRDILDGVWFIPDFHENNRQFPLRNYEAGLVVDALRARLANLKSTFLRVDDVQMLWWPTTLVEQINAANAQVTV